MLFSNPAHHSDNPPSSWTVHKHGRRWQLCTASGGILSSFDTKRQAEEAKEKGFYADLYAKESQWYSGLPVAGWKPYRADNSSRLRH
jgi:hypothetical protein